MYWQLLFITVFRIGIYYRPPQTFPHTNVNTALCYDEGWPKMWSSHYFKGFFFCMHIIFYMEFLFSSGFFTDQILITNQCVRRHTKFVKVVNKQLSESLRDHILRRWRYCNSGCNLTKPHPDKTPLIKALKIKKRPPGNVIGPQVQSISSVLEFCLLKFPH